MAEMQTAKGSGQGIERDGRRVTSEELTEVIPVGDNRSLVKVTVYALNNNGTTTASVALAEVNASVEALQKALS